MTDKRTNEAATSRIIATLRERNVQFATHGNTDQVWWTTENGVTWYAKGRPSVNGLYVKIETVCTPDQAIAATLGSDREAELIRAMEDVLRHSTDTVWVGEAETLVDRMVSLGVYKHDVYEGVRPWEAD